jgi:hypothetical protein
MQFDLNGGRAWFDFQGELGVGEDGVEELELLPGPGGGVEVESLAQGVADEEQKSVGGQQRAAREVVATKMGGGGDADAVAPSIVGDREGDDGKGEGGRGGIQNDEGRVRQIRWGGKRLGAELGLGWIQFLKVIPDERVL